MISTIEKVLFLKSVQLFATLPSEDLARVAQIANEATFRRDETFIRQGEMGDCLYVIIDGAVDVEVNGVGKVAELGPRSFVGDMAILSSAPRNANVKAAGDVICLRIDRDDFWDLMGDRPEIALGIIRELCRRLDDANRRNSMATMSRPA